MTVPRPTQVRAGMLLIVGGQHYRVVSLEGPQDVHVTSWSIDEASGQTGLEVREAISLHLELEHAPDPDAPVHVPGQLGLEVPSEADRVQAQQPVTPPR